MPAQTRGQSFELPCDATAAIRFIILAQKTLGRNLCNWPNEYNDFVKLLTSYQEGRIDLLSLLRQAQSYPCAHPKLVTKFKAFIPLGQTVTSPAASPARNSTIAGILNERELAEQKALHYVEKVKATYKNTDGSEGLETRIFLDLLQQKIDGQEDVAELRNQTHAVFCLHPSLANEFDQFLHREYFKKSSDMAGSLATPPGPEIPDLTSPTISPPFERLALPDEDLTPAQKTLDVQTCTMGIDIHLNSPPSQLSQALISSPVPSLFSSSPTVFVEASPSDCSVTLFSNAPSSPRMESTKELNSSSERASPVPAPLPFYPALSTDSGKNGDGWESSPALTPEKRMARKTVFGKGLMDLHLDCRQRHFTRPSPIARVQSSYPRSCNPNDTTFVDGVVSMPSEFDINEGGWIHGAARSRSVLYPFGVAAGKVVRLEGAPAQVKSALTIPLSLIPMWRPPIPSLPPKRINTIFSSRRSYAKVVQQGGAQFRPSSSGLSRMSPLAPPFQSAPGFSSGFHSTPQLSCLASTWVNSVAAGPPRSISMTSFSCPSTREKKRNKSRRGVGSDPDPVIPGDALRKTYGYGAVGEGRPGSGGR
ncbi:hypothetical protein FS837_007000 [Tulasnella sp. UAMH 9824]|nr:hypothetical protein FS837_007000 [Tulasnella sp. UAMH 9824]